MQASIHNGLRSGSLRGLAFKQARCKHTVAASSKQSVIREIHEQLSNKKRSAVEVTQQYLDAIARTDSTVCSYITVDGEQALAQARAVDARIAAGETLGPLAGVPLAIKDNICTSGTRTTAGSQILRDYVPNFDATAVSRLRGAGAVFLGKTNMDEFGMGSSTENSSFKPTRNPWDAERVPGGSSGGSAAAVAAHECAAALGSDTGGSIRQPAHFCGIVGLKPTYGRVSRYGLISYASSLDCIGPMAHTVEDAALLLSGIAGGDSHDATSSGRPVVDFAAGLATGLAAGGSRPLAGKRIGLVAQTMGEGVAPAIDEAVRAAARHLESLGATVEEVSLPTFGQGLPAYYVLALSEASSNLSRYDSVRYGARSPAATDLASLFAGSRAEGLGGEVKRRILMGTYALSAGYYDAYYKRAQQVRTLVQQEMVAALGRCDALLSPAAPSAAYKLGEKSSDPLAMYKGDLMTVNVNLAGLPALVLPAGFVPGSAEGGAELPIGLQLVGRAFDEAGLLGLGYAYEQTAGVPARRAPLAAVA
ncbi:hypothetical protein CHLRE_10g439400v5 [Chlamydomonas reinhardtii]|uniref:Glutamyl-tRNA(Gln) amidotransferase subunit A, chloroplastic/mitochondrial n=1 Tax=Chlamydomonas reinhardtii TaxID=3055 RepID=A8IIN4_CHLRE|nr:uncharacterized protein CHLRE_10g439400v5 [Chlamydomonas reinhardtii]PNW77502.1 hypothetical protein CHLRE_10g439400v5 [Chlamydomonas reinhardtii]|eukprot:XP_001690552.1 glutamyl tRNA amidotransferase, subunit A [Chlamydomonas reinhardtii]